MHDQRNIKLIFSKYYGQEPIKGKEYKFDEYGLVQKTVQLFSEANKPILGICAGIQEINVIFGGTLNQKIPNHDLKNQSKHKIILEEASFLYGEKDDALDAKNE